MSNIKLNKNTVNSKIQSATIKRSKLEKTSKISASFLTAFALEVSSIDFELSATHDFAQRNRNAHKKAQQILLSLKNDSLELSKTFVNHLCAQVFNMSTRTSNAMNNKDRQSTSAICIENDSMKASDKRSHYAVNTADTQASSTAYALDVCQIATYDTKARLVTLNDNEQALAFIKLCKAQYKTARAKVASK